MNWDIVERPGYLGTNRDEIHARWNERFGQGNWRIAWQWGERIIERPDALQVYQRGYTEFLRTNPDLLEWLTQFEDVFDTAPSNVQAGLSYDVQETSNNHIHDVAIRRAVILDLGLRFKGLKSLLHVRPNQAGECLGPQRIPFHLPHMIYRGSILYKGQPRNFTTNPPWWITMDIPNSVEEFYQQNKILLALQIY